MYKTRSFRIYATLIGIAVGLVFSFIGRVVYSFDHQLLLREVLFFSYNPMFVLFDMWIIILGVGSFFIASQKENQIHFFQSILRTLPYMVFLKEAKTLRFVHLNLAGERLLGIQESQLL